jgi:fumarate reductase subunit D
MRSRSGRVTLETITRSRRSEPEEVQMRGAGRVVFAATLLLLVGTLNIIYGIGALDGANVFVNDQRYVFTNLNTMGWVLIVLGIIQLAGGLSLMAGNTYGRVIGIIGGTLGAIGALLSVGGAYPWWSLAIFALCIYVIHGIIVFGEDDRPARA